MYAVSTSTWQPPDSSGSASAGASIKHRSSRCKARRLQHRQTQSIEAEYDNHRVLRLSIPHFNWLEQKINRIILGGEKVDHEEEKDKPSKDTPREPNTPNRINHHLKPWDSDAYDSRCDMPIVLEDDLDAAQQPTLPTKSNNNNNNNDNDSHILIPLVKAQSESLFDMHDSYVVVVDDDDDDNDGMYTINVNALLNNGISLDASEDEIEVKNPGTDNLNSQQPIKGYVIRNAFDYF